LIKIKFD